MSQTIRGDLIRSRMREKGFGDNMKALSKAAGLGETVVRDLLTPGRSRNPTQRTLRAVGQQLDLTVAEMVGEPPEPVRVSIIGTVSAGEGWIAVSDGEYETITLDASADAIALRVRGDSMSPAYRDGDLIIGARRATARADNLVGLDSIVELQDGRRFVKIIAKSAVKGCVTLRSYNVGHKDVEDVKLAWVAPVIWVRRGG